MLIPIEIISKSLQKKISALEIHVLDYQRVRQME